MFLYGAGGHAKVIMDILHAQGEPVHAVFDDNPNISTFENIPVKHSILAKFPLIISIGDNTARKKIAEANPGEYGIALHPSAIISPSATIGIGTVVMPGAVINAGAKIGKHCIINTGASIDHDCIIEDFAHISPHATLCGNVQVGEGSQIGAGAIITPGIKIGAWSLICAGTMLCKNIPNFTKASTRHPLPPPVFLQNIGIASNKLYFRSGKGRSNFTPRKGFAMQRSHRRKYLSLRNILYFASEVKNFPHKNERATV